MAALAFALAAPGPLSAALSGCVAGAGADEPGLGGIGGKADTTAVPAMRSCSRTFAGGLRHYCVLSSAGPEGHEGISCWGDNDGGQLGDGTRNDAPAPVAVRWNGSGLRQLAAGPHTTCAVAEGEGSGRLYCWGARLPVEFELAPDNLSSVPGNVALEPELIHEEIDPQALEAHRSAVALGDDHACILARGGGVECWGDNVHHQLGSRSLDRAARPEQVTGITDAVQVAAGGATSCALGADGRVYCWGANDLGQLGRGDTASRPEPRAIPGLERIVQLDLGQASGCAVDHEGTVWCWGANDVGQLGVDPGVRRDGAYETSPVRVEELPPAETVDVGPAHACAVLRAGGSIVCWGDHRRGELGAPDLARGIHGSELDPIAQPNLTREAVTGVSNACAVASGEGSACALTGPLQVQCWGSGAEGARGNGERTWGADARPTPVFPSPSCGEDEEDHELDRFEPNGSRAEATWLASADDWSWWYDTPEGVPVDQGELEVEANFHAAEDVDWYRIAVRDTLSGAIWPTLELEAPPEGAGPYDVCAYYELDHPKRATLCPEAGQESRLDGGPLTGCCVTVTDAKRMVLDVDGLGSNESGTLWIRLAAAESQCTGYRFRVSM